jgi:ABC-2 type transport system permease protein
MIIIFFALVPSFSKSMHRYNAITSMKIDIVNKDQSNLSKLLINSFKSNEGFNRFISFAVCSNKDAQSDYKNGYITAIVIIPDNFSRGILYGDNYALSIILNQKEPLKGLLFENMMKSYCKYVTSVQNSSYSLYNNLDMLPLTLEEKDNIDEQVSAKMTLTALSRNSLFEDNSIEFIPSSNSGEYFFIGIMLTIIMFNSIWAGNFMLYERNSKCLMRLKLASVNDVQIVLSKNIVFTIINLLQAFIFYLIATITGNTGIININSYVVVFFILSVFFMSNMCMLLALFLKDENKYTLVSNILIFFLCLAGGNLIPLQLLPKSVLDISKLTPNYWIIKEFLYLINLNLSYESISIFIGFLLLNILLLGVITLRGMKNEFN